jgi:hypothetical protein
MYIHKILFKIHDRARDAAQYESFTGMIKALGFIRSPMIQTTDDKTCNKRQS